MKVGDIVYCSGVIIESGGLSFTLLYDGEYQISAIFNKDNDIMLCGKIGIYKKDKFMTLKEYRKLKLQQICSNSEMK